MEKGLEAISEIFTSYGEQVKQSFEALQLVTETLLGICTSGGQVLSSGVGGLNRECEGFIPLTQAAMIDVLQQRVSGPIERCLEQMSAMNDRVEERNKAVLDCRHYVAKMSALEADPKLAENEKGQIKLGRNKQKMEESRTLMDQTTTQVLGGLSSYNLQAVPQLLGSSMASVAKLQRDLFVEVSKKTAGLEIGPSG